MSETKAGAGAPEGVLLPTCNGCGDRLRDVNGILSCRCGLRAALTPILTEEEPAVLRDEQRAHSAHGEVLFEGEALVLDGLCLSGDKIEILVQANERLRALRDEKVHVRILRGDPQ